MKEAGRNGARVEGRAEQGALEPKGPEAVSRSFARALLNRDPKAAATWFAPAGVILTADATEVTGRTRIAEVLAQVTVAEQNVEISIGRTVVAAGVAVCTQFWRGGEGSSGKAGHETETIAQLVLVLTDRWQIAIANPWG